MYTLQRVLELVEQTGIFIVNYTRETDIFVRVGFGVRL